MMKSDSEEPEDEVVDGLGGTGDNCVVGEVGTVVISGTISVAGFFLRAERVVDLGATVTTVEL